MPGRRSNVCGPAICTSCPGNSKTRAWAPPHAPPSITGQHPFATVLTCSDSRVPPEAIFSQGLGDLFVVRVAGAVPDQSVLGSIEYAAEHLHVPLVVVMGHIACGAVKSAMESAPPTSHDPANANLEHILSGIRPSLAHLPASGDNWENAVYASVARNLNEVLRLSPVITEFAHAEKVVVVGAVYNLQTGKVEFLPSHAVVARSIPKPR